MNRTGWYSAKINPVRKGWYEVALGGNKSVIHKCYWTGLRWRWSEDSVFTAAIYGNWGDLWRGLAEKAK